MVNVNNVVVLNQNSVHEDIQTFLGKMELHSKNTRMNYERSICKFFMYMKNKSIEQLTIEDLKFRNNDMVKYQLFLKEQYANITVNSYMSAIVSLYDYFEKNDYPVKSKTMKVDPLSDDGETYGKMTVQEAETFATLAKDQVKGQEKSSLIRLAYTTSFRKQELLNLEWSDIVYNGSQNVYLVHVIGKGGKKHTQPISHDMFSELLKIKEQKYYQRYNDNKIFHLSNQAIQDMMDRIKEEMGIEEERNIVFHSLRNVAPSFIMETTGNIMEAKRQLNHSNVNTTVKNYLEQKQDYLQMASIQIEDKIDSCIFDELTHEELLNMVKGFGNGIGFQLRLAAKKIVEER